MSESINVVKQLRDENVKKRDKLETRIEKLDKKIDELNAILKKES